MDYKKVSIIILFLEWNEDLKKQIESIKNQKIKLTKEIILVHDTRYNKRKINDLTPKYVKYIRVENSKGIPFNRNYGISKATGDIIVFIDDDCIPKGGWLYNLISPILNNETEVTMGKVNIVDSNYLGNSISRLGFPAGGSLGFENIWRVDNNGFTNHISTCNCAIQKKVVHKIGLFDENLIYGAEDAEISLRIIREGFHIKYIPSAKVVHGARKDIKSFLSWQIRRGKANYYFKRKVGKINNFIKLRLWSTSNIIKLNFFKKEFFLILILLPLSFIMQQLGYLQEILRN